MDEPHSAINYGKKVFLSYSHDSTDHVKKVLALSDKLRSDGIDCNLDQYEESPEEGWPRWMEKQIRDSDFVIMVCTENYYKRVMGEEDANKGLGVKWEGHLIYQHVYNASTRNRKFIPVVLDVNDKKFVPTPIQGSTNYVLDGDYEKLYLRLTSQAQTPRPPLGKIRIGVKEVKTDPVMFLTSPIDIPLWNKARWRATAVLIYPDQPPDLGICFANEEAARSIFEGWHKRYGRNDEFEELRVSIIEGTIGDLKPGYSVHIGADPEGMMHRFEDSGFKFDDKLFAFIGRVNRMTPEAGKNNLAEFKLAYRKAKTYNLIPVILDKERQDPLFDLGIRKRKISFRKAEDIRADDIDVVVLDENYRIDI